MTGSDNVGVGFRTGDNVITANNVISIGSHVDAENVSDSCYIGNIFTQTSVGGIPVFVNSNNKLGAITSSKRVKEHIMPMDTVQRCYLRPSGP